MFRVYIHRLYLSVSVSMGKLAVLSLAVVALAVFIGERLVTLRLVNIYISRAAIKSLGHLQTLEQATYTYLLHDNNYSKIV